ncbi:DNA polymerase III subunit psi [Ferrimonas senticii]|uniref:DNA polymerase III subunit psi n=1 Tax=Ferrimonas senticii TaxID=394566 RepID=UPI000489340A|nr:DNA polymerase III subunit psi [Ferrimonas senticii]
MTTLSQRQLAVLQQMGITAYQIPAAPAELCLINVTEAELAHPLIADVLQLLGLSPQQCVLASAPEQVKAKRYWQLKHDMPSRATHLFSASLSELSDPAAKRKLWQRLQQWI